MISKIKGLEYFNIDVNILSDVRIFKLMKRYGPLGFTSYMAIISHIYSKGYYVDYDLDTLAYLLLKHIPSKYINGRNKLQEIILYMVELELFDKQLFSNGIITSIDIQEMFVNAAKKRQKQEDYPYWLLEEINNVVKTEEHKNLIEEEIKPNKKQKRMNQRMKEIKEKAPFKHYLTSCLITYRYIDEYSLDIYKYNELFENLEKAYDSSLLFDATKYLCNYASRSSTNIDDPYNYFESSITTNLERLTSSRNTNNSSDIQKLFNELFADS
jgi:hypothetical protein